MNSVDPEECVSKLPPTSYFGKKILCSPLHLFSHTRYLVDFNNIIGPLILRLIDTIQTECSFDSRVRHALQVFLYLALRIKLEYSSCKQGEAKGITIIANT